MPLAGQPRAVAQLGSALDWGSSGRRFKSCQPDTCRKVGQGHLLIIELVVITATGSAHNLQPTIRGLRAKRQQGLIQSELLPV